MVIMREPTTSEIWDPDLCLPIILVPLSALNQPLSTLRRAFLRPSQVSFLQLQLFCLSHPSGRSAPTLRLVARPLVALISATPGTTTSFRRSILDYTPAATLLFWPS